jgi:hypothetical protein
MKLTSALRKLGAAVKLNNEFDDSVSLTVATGIFSHEDYPCHYAAVISDFENIRGLPYVKVAHYRLSLGYGFQQPRIIFG